MMRGAFFWTRPVYQNREILLCMRMVLKQFSILFIFIMEYKQRITVYDPYWADLQNKKIKYQFPLNIYHWLGC